ncbi:MAG: hypothetical protein ABJ084_12070 [Halioglobus sp.]
MSIDERQWCIFLPCGNGDTWAVPQNAVAEIVTVEADSSEPPATLMWRGRNVPVVDPGTDKSTPWRDKYGRSGLVAVMLGLEGEELEYWGVAVRGEGLTIKDMRSETVEDAQDQAHEHALTAFRLNQHVVQIPDLAKMQHELQSTQ